MVTFTMHLYYMFLEYCFGYSVDSFPWEKKQSIFKVTERMQPFAKLSPNICLLSSCNLHQAMFDGIPVRRASSCPKEDLSEARDMKTSTQANGPPFYGGKNTVPATGVSAHGQSASCQDPMGVVTQQIVLRGFQLGCFDQLDGVIAGGQLPNLELPKPFSEGMDKHVVRMWEGLLARLNF